MFVRKEYADCGLFSLTDVSPRLECRVFLPSVIFRFLNSRVSLCSPELLDPFNIEWSSFESIWLQSMWF